jgi:hypothetical protein
MEGLFSGQTMEPEMRSFPGRGRADTDGNGEKKAYEMDGTE